MEKERIMLVANCTVGCIRGLAVGIAGWCTFKVALEKIDGGNPAGWIVPAILFSYLAAVIIRDILEKRLAGAGEAVE